MKVTADANVLVRAAIRDDAAQSPAAEQALRAASVVFITNTALCEFVWVLSRSYKQRRSEIAQAIETLIKARNVEVDRPAVETGLAFLEAGADFADGVIAYEGMRLGSDALLTFDVTAQRAARTLKVAVRIPGAH